MHLRTASFGSRATAALLLVLCALSATSTHAAPLSPPPNLDAELDAMLSAAFPADAPGATVIVVKGGSVLYRKGFGRANLELQVPMRPENVFEIGSVTKQFTATAVLMLVEEGKLALNDDVRKFIPEFPDKGAVVTIEHLLTHTSGVPSYTELPAWLKLWRQDMTPSEILALTRDLPLEFTPGTKFKYDNTGYTMLGMVIEKVSGMSYADFISKRIFEPCGMRNSVYGSKEALVANRAFGYSKDERGWRNAAYLSMTQPYAAGSLMSSVDDLAAWDRAVSAGKLLSKASWDRAFTPYRLPNGESTNYGYGWVTETFENRKVIRHNGGISGYVSEVLRIPEEGLYVALLTNSDTPPVDTGFLVTKIAAAAIGKPYREPAAITLDEKTLDSFVGVYDIDATASRAVTREGTRLFTQRTGRPKLEVFASSQTEFFYKDSFTRITFERDAAGNVTGMVVKTQDGASQRAARTNKPLPAEPVSVAVDPSILAQYSGVYEIAPAFSIEVTADGGRLFAQATGQPKFELFAKTPTEFFLKVVDARIVFSRSDDGKVSHLTLYQGGQEVPGRKVR